MLGRRTPGYVLAFAFRGPENRDVPSEEPGVRGACAQYRAAVCGAPSGGSRRRDMPNPYHTFAPRRESPAQRSYGDELGPLFSAEDEEDPEIAAILAPSRRKLTKREAGEMEEIREKQSKMPASTNLQGRKFTNTFETYGGNIYSSHQRQRKHRGSTPRAKGQVADLWKEWVSGCDTSDQAGNVAWEDPVAAVLQAETTDEYPMFYAWKKKLRRLGIGTGARHPQDRSENAQTPPFLPHPKPHPGQPPQAMNAQGTHVRVFVLPVTSVDTRTMEIVKGGLNGGGLATLGLPCFLVVVARCLLPTLPRVAAVLWSMIHRRKFGLQMDSSRSVREGYWKVAPAGVFRTRARSQGKKSPSLQTVPMADDGKTLAERKVSEEADARVAAAEEKVVAALKEKAAAEELATGCNVSCT
eukprot:jgi/Tetstr1/448442/TSEL_035711.t1